MARSELLTCPKFRAAVRDLKLPVPYVVGLLEMIWQTGYAQADPVLGSPDDVEMAADWPGKAGELFPVLLARGWVEQVGDDTYAIHAFWEHAPRYVKIRRDRIASRENKDLRAETCAHERTVCAKRRTTPHHTTPHKENTSSASPPAISFDRFWEAWPTHKRKVARKQCLAHWRANGLDGEVDAIIAGLEIAKASPEWREQQGKYIPAPLVWLHQRRWEALLEAAVVVVTPQYRTVKDALNER